MVPVYKKGSKKDPANYCPVSLICIIMFKNVCIPSVLVTVILIIISIQPDNKECGQKYVITNELINLHENYKAYTHALTSNRIAIE